MTLNSTRQVSLKDLGEEPFRLFFPAAVLAGLVGTAVWPLHFSGMLELYPGQAHARLMVYGLFGGFILGFLGTAMPRMLSAPALGIVKVTVLLGLHLSMVGVLGIGRVGWGDHLFLALLLTFVAVLLWRGRQRQDTPPPGFVLAGLALLCGICGAALAVAQHYNPELPGDWIVLQRLLSYQGFVLLPILGVGPYLLPRFFGLSSLHDFPVMKVPDRRWCRKAALGVVAGGIIIGSFLLEVRGWIRLAHTLRFGATFGYLLVEFPFRLAPKGGGLLGCWLRLAFAVLLVGFLAVAIIPAYRVALLHLTLVGGFAAVAFVVATRVVYGHSGNQNLLQKRNRWLTIAMSLMLLAMATRISGDFWPKIMITHYVYGALAWMTGAVVWAVYVLPKVMQMEED
jgi:uncharacterized protein involved in response to NO